MKASLVVMTVFLLVGCSTFDYSQHRYFESYIGTDVPLAADVVVCSSNYYDKYQFEKIYIDYRFREFTDGSEEWKCGRDEFVLILPKGHLIKLNAVYQKVLRGVITSTNWIAVGEFTTDSGKNVKFQYKIAGSSRKFWHTPWEDQSLKVERIID